METLAYFPQMSFLSSKRAIPNKTQPPDIHPMNILEFLMRIA
ncbi:MULTISPECIES: hypothetical protein [unclassified Microcoleus]